MADDVVIRYPLFEIQNFLFTINKYLIYFIIINTYFEILIFKFFKILLIIKEFNNNSKANNKVQVQGGKPSSISVRIALTFPLSV